MLKTFLVVLTCLFVAAPVAMAQRRPEVFVGYTNLQSEGLPNRNQPSWPFNTDFFRDRTTQHGVNVAFSGYGISGFGFTGDASWARQGTSSQFTGGDSSRHTDTYYFMGGPALKFNRSGPSKAEPFLRVMAGAAHTRFKADTNFASGGGTSSSSFTVGSTDFTASAGGGLDLRLGEWTKLRVVQVDYAPVFLRDRTVNVLGSNGVLQPTTLNGQRQDNFRFSFGIVF
jgi:hypothetical protein